MPKLSLETASRLHEQLRLQISDFEKMADTCASILMSIEIKQETNLIVSLKGILKTQLILCYINLDLFAAYRQYLSTDTSTNYEKRQAMTKINMVMSEGYKKVYSFKERPKKSLWGLQIRMVVDYLEKYKDEYHVIENLLIDMGKDQVLNQDMRNLSIHYDDDPLKVYQMLSNLSAEEVTNRCNKFIIVFEKLIKFVGVLTKEMQMKIVDNE